MEVQKVSFSFLKAQMFVEIPFFQRPYVWKIENWQELLDDLKENRNSHFLGSIILKSKRLIAGEIPQFLVIDGQQRLTTLSILLKVCYDSLETNGYSQTTNDRNKSKMEEVLFVTKDTFEDDRVLKMIHSRVDRIDYQFVISGDGLCDEIAKVANDKDLNSRKIIRCYDFFKSEVDKLSKEEKETLWKTLIDDYNYMLVKIDLDSEENEQDIFDTINSAGVRLSCGDTIKNALFQKAIEEVKNSPNYRRGDEDKVVKFYNDTWASTFSDSIESSNYWGKSRTFGRLVRDNLEILLHSVAIIKSFFNPVEHRISDLPNLYKSFIEDMNYDDLKEFIHEIEKYANLYRENVIEFDSSVMFSYDENIKRLLHILDTLEVSTFHPYILKLLNDFSNNEELLSSYLKKIEKYVMRHIICKVTTKNFNKECALMICGEKTIDDYFIEKKDILSDFNVIEGLKNITSNGNAALILFWIELYRRKNLRYDSSELKYNYSLEHIMPQKWTSFWGVEEIKVYNDDGSIEENPEKAAQIRTQSISSIGNMTLLTSNLNSTLRNLQFSLKVEGQGRRKGIKEYSSLSITKEIVCEYDQNKIWDERSIRERTNRLILEFINLW